MIIPPIFFFNLVILPQNETITFRKNFIEIQYKIFLSRLSTYGIDNITRSMFVCGT